MYTTGCKNKRCEWTGARFSLTRGLLVGYPNSTVCWNDAQDVSLRILFYEA